jgi:hypothetical protein
MQVELNPDGTTNTAFRPHIFGENTTYNTRLYDPHTSHGVGLYSNDTRKATYDSWPNHFTKFKQETNSASVNRVPSAPASTYGTATRANGTQGPYARLNSL